MTETNSSATPTPASALSTIQFDYNWHATVDRAWRNEAVRREFEAATGFTPLALSGAEHRKQVDTGYFHAYSTAFSVWATEGLDLIDKAPSAIREAIARASE